MLNSTAIKIALEFRKARAELGITLREVASDTGINMRFVAAFEHCKPVGNYYPKIETLCEYYGINIDEVLNENN